MTHAGASELMRSLELLVDGPVRWGSPVASRSAGVFVVELPGGAPQAPLDHAAVRRWLERVPDLTLDGHRPTVQQLVRRLAELWLPGEPVLYVGRSARAIGARVAAMHATPLGDARPYSGGHWLKTLAQLGELRLWWAETEAHEEYQDALLEQVAARNAAADGAPRLPFANLGDSGSGDSHGLTGSLRTDAEAAVVTAAATRKTAANRAQARRPEKTRKPTAPRGGRERPRPEQVALSREGLERLSSELEELRTVVRPRIIAHVKAARELGDLRENGDYEYARKEQSFVEGRIQTLERLLRTGVVIESELTEHVRLGSTVEVENDGERVTYVIVGSAEARPAYGRLSDASPVGRALIGARAGDVIVIQSPGGSISYRVIEVR